MGLDPVERFINTLRDSVPNAEEVYTNGNCYKLFLLLRLIFPGAKPHYDIVAGHVYTQINGKYYDIKGKFLPRNHVQLFYLPEEPRIFKQAIRWRYAPLPPTPVSA